MQDNNQPQSKPLHLTIRTREAIVKDVDIKNLSSINDKGLFDVLDQHANFISIVKEKLLLRYPDGREEEVPIDQGVLKVRENQIDIYLGIKTQGS
jgi:F0F1-type ATP synthase epsilon subunit